MITKKLLRSFLLGTLCCLPVTALLAQNTPNYGTWGVYSHKLSTAQTAPDSDPTDLQQIYSLLITMAKRWDAHHFDGFLNVFWDFPDLLVVLEREQIKGLAG